MEDDDDRIVPKSKIPELFRAIDGNKELLIDNLKEIVSIPTISNAPEHDKDILKMMKICTEKLEKFGAIVEIVDGNNETSSNLPPVLFGNLFTSEEYKTICVYGNIDTLSPEKSENDKQSPFKLIEKNERLYGLGISDNKAPLLCWFNALKIYKMTKNEIPVNIKFVIEGTSELYSQSLTNAIQKKREFFNNVEFICLTIDKRVNELPCLKYGYRGLCHFSLTVNCGEKRVHSGTYGGAFNQPLMDAVNTVESFLNKHGKVIVPGFGSNVKANTEINEKHYSLNECCSIESLKKESGVKMLSHKEKVSRIILHRTCLPSFTVNAFQILSDLADKKDCASIPNKIEAKFSVRLVLYQTVKQTYDQFKAHIEKIWHLNKVPNDYEFKLKLGFDPWQEDPASNHYEAATKAIQNVFNQAPVYVAEGGTMPAVSIFNNYCPASSIIVMPISGHNDNHHSNMESISIDGYIKGIKLTIAYMCEIHELSYKWK